VLILVLVAEPDDLDFVKATADAIRKHFGQHVDDGLLEVRVLC
jgi:hypothetical protein